MQLLIIMKNLNSKTFFSIIYGIVLFISIGCTQNTKPIKITVQDYYNCQDKLTKTIVHDIFSPPVASRIYVYPNIAAYEILIQEHKKHKSFIPKIKELNEVPKTENPNVNLRVSALIAYIEISKKLVFTHDLINKFQDSLYNAFKKTNAKEFKASEKYALHVVRHIQNWIEKDNYKETRTMPRFVVDTDSVSRWQPTPPNYMDGIEPHWNKIRPLIIDSISQFKPKKHPKFSLEKESPFFKELQEVYNVTKIIKKKGDDSEEIKIAQFWDCNPYVAVNTGHLKVTTKKITPGAHWIGITKIACKKNKLNLVDAIYAHTYTTIGIFDAFISCWDEKYRSNLTRPETLINKYLDSDWVPLLQTPPFPEYTSGHSVVSGAASTILTDIFKDNFSFTDTTELPYGLPSRTFSSFNQAAKEAAISRLYGGIHYRAAVENGLDQGIKLGEYVLEKCSK